MYHLSLLGCLALLFGCYHSSDTGVQPWQPFFTLLSEGADKELLAQFTHAELDSTGNSIDLIRAEVVSALQQLPIDSPLLQLLDSLTGGDQEVKVLVSSIAYHLHSNDDPITIRDLRHHYLTIAEHKAWLEYGLPIFEARSSLARMNDQRIRIEDTVRICLPVGSLNGQRTALYPSFNDHKERDTIPLDTLVLIGVVLSKSYGELYPRGVDSSDLIYHLELLDISDAQITLYRDAIAQGDTLRFHVKQYGRDLQKWSSPR